MLLVARVAQLLGLIVTGAGFFVGVLGHDERRELLLLAIGAAIFFGGRALQSRSA